MIRTSIYPSAIDDRVFFQDMQIKDVPAFEQYQKYISDGAYGKAGALLDSLDVTSFSAWMLNWFNGKLINIEKEANRKDLIIKQYAQDAQDIADNLYLTYYQTTEPTIADLNENDSWIK